MENDVVYVVPAYEPEENLFSLAEELLAKMDSKLIVVDDGSSKSKHELFDRVQALDFDRISILRHPVNMGKGAALKTAIREVQNTDCVGMVTLDADGQHLIEDVVQVGKFLRTNPESLILGVRQFKHEIPARSKIGNVLTRNLFQILIGKKISDTQTGLRGIPASFLPRLNNLRASRYDFELEMLILAARNRDILEVPIATIYENGNESSHFNPIFDSFRIYFVLLRFLFSSLLTAGSDLLVFTLLFSLSANLVLSFIFGRVIGLLVSVFASKEFVFRSKSSLKSIAPKFLALWLGLMGISYTATLVLIKYFAVDVYVARICTDTVLFSLNFFIQREFIFASQKTAGPAVNLSKK